MAAADGVSPTKGIDEEPLHAPEEPGDKEWTEDEFARLVGFEEGDDNLSPPTETGSAAIRDGEDVDGNVISDEELFGWTDEAVPQKRSLSSSPWAKLGLVGSGLFVVFLVAGLFLNQIWEAGSKIGKNEPATLPKSNPKPTVVGEEGENIEGKLKTELALSQQADELKQVDEARQKNPEDEGEERWRETEPSKHSPQRAAASEGETPVAVRSRPSIQSYRTAPPSRNRSRAATVSALPRREPPRRISPQESENEERLDPTEQWQRLARLGNYGRASSSESGRDRGQIASAVSQTEPGSPSEREPSPERDAPSSALLERDESRILDGVPIGMVTVGTRAEAVLTTPAIWSGTGETNQQQHFVVTLSEPLWDGSGREVMPAGTRLIFAVSGVADSGLMAVLATSVVEGERDYPLPEGALTLRGKGGEPLLARGWFDRGGEIASMDISTAVLGALAKVGQTLNLPERETSQSISNGTSSSTVSSTRRNPNIFGAVLEGGATPLLEQIVERNQRAIQEMEGTDDLWYVPAGESVQVFVNQSFQF
jgi:hypothetical protein